MTRTPSRTLSRTLARRAGSATAVALLATALAGPAHASPPTTRTVEDPTDTAAAYDVTRVVLRAAPREGRAAVVVVRHAREVGLGDAVDVWFDLDGDRAPDLHLTGHSFSEYAVYETESFDSDDRNVSGRGCVRLSMEGTTSKVRVLPDCLEDPTAFAVAVRSSDGASEEDASGDDWAPGVERFTRRVAAVA